MKIIRVGTENYHHQSGPNALTKEFSESINGAVLADLLLREEWKGRCEIVPDYKHANAGEDVRTRCVVRIAIRTDGVNKEPESYSYLRHSCGPQQGFFWDCYGDDLHTIELAIMAIHQAPAPYYTGPIVFKMNLKP